MKKLKVYSVVVATFAIIVGVLLHNRAQIKAETQNLHASSFAVTVAPVEERAMTHDLDLVGTIDANNDVHIVAQASGKVTKVLVRVGEYKRAGSVLLQVDDTLQAAALKLAEVSLEKATKDYERYKRLYKEGSVTDSQLESAQLAYESAKDKYVVARRQYDNTSISTPISGYVTSRKVNLGDYVTPGMSVAEVVDISMLKITVHVNERDIMDFRPGDNVKITTDVYPGTDFEGRIKTISSKADADHTYPVEVEFPNSLEHPLKAGMFATVFLTARAPSESLVIPRQSLVGSVESPQVFVVKNGTAMLRKIVVGSGYNNYLQVLGGLHLGERVVTTGQDNLENGYKVEVAG